MLQEFKNELQSHLEKTLKGVLPSEDTPAIELEVPAEEIHGDFSTNIALKSTKQLKKPPMAVAEEFASVIRDGLSKSPLSDKVDKVEIKKPGFINFYLNPNALYDVLEEVFERQDSYGTAEIGKKQNIQIEFVSANPTGPLSVAHARQAVVGDALGNILKALGSKVTKEYYVNDQGNQIKLLGESIRCRALEILGEKVSLPDEGYQGEYIKEIAALVLQDTKSKTVEDFNKINNDVLINNGIQFLINEIKKDLKDFNVHFDVWSHESNIANAKTIEKVLKELRSKDFIYEKDGALWFKSTDFGDDKDRVVQKSDGAYTYLAPDIVYHKDKFKRGFNKVINIWGPDHHGYITRLKAACQALGQAQDAMEVLIVQLATIYRDGKPLSMSTRKGEFISLRDVIDEVGVDAARYFFLMRNIKAHLDFDLELAKKETPENPVYYIQYAHARIHSINKKAKEEGVSLSKKDFSRLKEEEELALIKRIGIYPEILLICHKHLDPYPLVNYLLELAIGFHRFYDKHKVIDRGKEVSEERLGLVNATLIVLVNGLRLLGISTPEKM